MIESPTATALGTVYVIQRVLPRVRDGWQPNLEPATHYGRLDFLFEPQDRVFAAPVKYADEVAAKLENFDAETDFLLPLHQGDPAAAWTVVMLLLARGHRRLRFLYWSRGKRPDGTGMWNENGYYYPVEIDLSPARFSR